MLYGAFSVPYCVIYYPVHVKGLHSSRAQGTAVGLFGQGVKRGAVAVAVFFVEH